MTVEEYTEKTNLTLLGDSITQGLGSKKINFTDSLQECVGDAYRVINLARTGTVIDYALELVNGEGFPKNGVCVVLCGNVDAQIRPNQKGKIFPLIPGRFQKNGMLMPRPFYSSSLRKNILQHGDNLLRNVFSKLIIAVDGTEQWVELDDFTAKYRELVQTLLSRGISCICCSTVYLDEKLFKGTSSEYVVFNAAMKQISQEAGAQYVNLYSLLEKQVGKDGWDAVYNHDHFHPKEKGYKLMAHCIAEAVSTSM